MKRAFTNFLVDGVIAAAFFVTAVSGVLFLLPKSWIVGSASGTPTMLGVATASWLTIHDWSGIAMMAGVALHCALHWRWIVNMTRRTFGRRQATQLALNRRVQGGRESVPAPATPGVPAARPAVAASRRTPDDGSARFTRAGFLKGAALVCGGLVAGGAVGRGLVATATGSTPAATGAAATGTATTAQSATPAGSVTAQSGSAQAGTNGDTATATTVARVTVDRGACIGCGRCIGVCPQGVFAASGGRATAADPAACVLCQRCLRICPANAITLNA